MSAASSSWKARYFEDYIVGEVHEFGHTIVDEKELIEFAERYDPQPFHIDAATAAKSHFGGLITSGWHTCAILMRMMTDEYISEVAALGSPGVDEIRWLVPVRPGHELRARITVTEARQSKSKPDRGIVRSHIELLNQDGATVMTMQSLGLFLCRPAPQA